MTPSDSALILLRMLAEVGVSEDCPDPAAAWEVFKQYANISVDCTRDYLFFQVGDLCSEYGLDGYFEFTREFEMRGVSGDEPVWFEQVYVLFKVQPKHQFGLGTVTMHSTDFPSDVDFFAAVEQLPAFQAGLVFPDYVLTVDHTGV